MLRYADAIVKRGVDKLIDAIGQSPEAQTESAETPQPQKSMGNNTNCPPQATGNTTNSDLTEQTITLMDEQCDMHYNVPDRTPEVQRFVTERAQPVICAIIVCWHAVWPKCPAVPNTFTQSLKKLSIRFAVTAKDCTFVDAESILLFFLSHPVPPKEYACWRLRLQVLAKTHLWALHHTQN